MRRLLAAFFFVVLATAPVEAVSTTTLTLTTSWQDLGAGPLQLQTNNQSQTIYQIADSVPLAGASGFFLQGNSVPQVAQTTSHVYVRLRNLTGNAVVTYAPVVAASSGGGGSVTQGTTPWADNVSQFGGSNVVTGTGASGAGIPRVTVSNDSIFGATQSGTWLVGATEADGANVTLGLKGDAASAAASASLMARVFQLHSDLVGPTPAAQAGPALGPSAALGVVQQDGQTTTLTGSAAGALTNGTYATGAIPTAGYQSVSVQLTGVGTGNTVTYEVSNDGVTFITDNGGQTPGNGGTAATTGASNSVGQVNFGLKTAYFRIRISTYGSGTVTAVVTMKVTPLAPIATYVTQGGGGSSASPWHATQDVISQPGGVVSFSRLPSSAATTNLTNAKTSAGRVYKIVACNTTTTPYRIKFYNAASTGAVTVGTTVPIFTRPVPAAGAAGGLACATYDVSDIGWYFSTGITWATTTGAADTDTTALAAGQGTDISVEYQ